MGCEGAVLSAAAAEAPLTVEVMSWRWRGGLGCTQRSGARRPRRGVSVCTRGWFSSGSVLAWSSAAVAVGWWLSGAGLALHEARAETV